MYNYKKSWFSKHNGMISESAFGFATCMYAMSLEAWRRGLDVTFKLKNKKRLFNGISYTVSDGTKVHKFDGSKGDASDPKTATICQNKGITNKYLRDAYIPVPTGKSFEQDTENNDILKYADKIGYPLVLKPIGGGGGVGVVTNIKYREELEKFLKNLRDKRTKKEVIVERFIVGEDYRILVLDGKVIGAFHRRAQSVVGDGETNIKTLLMRKNEERNTSPFLSGSKIKIDDKMRSYLKEQNKSIAFIPSKGERIFLRRNGEFFGQRDSVNMTNDLTPEIKQIAIDAVEAIPGLKYGGVDMLVDMEKNVGVINEVNSKPQIGNHLFPIEGEAVDIPRIIFDYYFPETKYEETPNSQYYFDFKPIIENFRNATASEIKLPLQPKKEAIAQRYLVTGNNFNERYFRRIKREARELSISGSIEVRNKDLISLTLSGKCKDIEKLVMKLDGKLLKKVRTKIVEESEYKDPIKIGFEIIKKSSFTES